MAIGQSPTLASDLVSRTELRRQRAAETLNSSRRSELGQFFTPAEVATFMASMVKCSSEIEHIRVLDPGAGVGSLTAAVVKHLLSDPDVAPSSLHIVAYEIDAGLHDPLRETLADSVLAAQALDVPMTWELRGSDYITDAAASASGQLDTEPELFDIIVMNPPYRKINTSSAERESLCSIGLRVSNLYTAFVALAATQLRSQGVLVAITPRSFANGPYHEPFRDFLLSRVGIERLHVFASRGIVFADADVLQENVVYAVRRGATPEHVALSISTGIIDQATTREVPYSEVIRPGDTHQVWHIPVERSDTAVAHAIHRLPSRLHELGVSVSTGRVVDFRAREFLSADASTNTVPLIYPVHFCGSRIVWPAPSGGRKPNALIQAPETQKLLLPNETYVLVKRFTSKEERRRVSAAVASPDDLPGDVVAFENHLNVFHQDEHGLEPHLARGLAAFLNSSYVDQYVRAFNGHTQINATDLRGLRYPSIDQLRELGAAFTHGDSVSQDKLDTTVARLVPAFEALAGAPGDEPDEEPALAGSCV